MNEFKKDPSIEKYLSIAKDKESGLTLVSAGTGRGKSTECVDFIKENYSKFSKILYVSPNHPLIITEMLPRLMKEPNLCDHVVYLKSAFKNMTDGDEIFGVDSDAIKNKKVKESIASLKSQCRYYKAAKKDPTVDLEAIEKSITSIKSELKAYVRKIRTINIDNEIITIEEMDELKKVFPEDIVPEKNIYLMTADKLEARLDSLITPYKIMSTDFFKKNTLVILDEADKDYDTFLKHCCEENNPLEDALAPIQTLEKNISFEDGHWDKCKFDDNEEKIIQARQELSELINEVNDKFKILYNFRIEGLNDGKSVDMFSSNGRNFMLNLDDGKRYSLNADDEQKSTVLRKVTTGQENFNIFEFIFDIKKLIDRMWSFVIVIANTRQREMNELNIDTTYEDCLSYAVHQAFNKLSSEAKPYVEHIMNISIQNDVLARKENADIDRGKVWRDGFLNIALKDAQGSNHTYVQFSGMVSNTPENIIAWLARRANVLSLSATQQIGGAFLPNFDFIKRVIGIENFHEYSDEDFKASENSRARNENNIDVSVIKTEWNNVEIIDRYTKAIKEKCSSEGAVKLVNAITSYLVDLELGTRESYKLNKNRKLFVLVMDFILNPKAVTGLLILNNNYNIMNESFINLLKCYSKEAGSSDIIDNIYCLNASNLKETDENRYLEEYKNKANNGEKVLIISNKEAVGQGLNLQPDKDINYFYQEYPTHIMPNINDQKNRLDRSEKNKAIYRVRFMGDRGELNEEEERNWIKTINNSGREMIRYNDRKSLKLAAVYRLVQGWGRITRSSQKEENTFIIIDENTCKLYEEIKSAHFSKTEEVYRILETIDEWNRESQFRHDNDPLLLEFKREMIDKNEKLNREIQSILRVFASGSIPSILSEKKKRYDLIRNTLVNGGMIIGKNGTSGIFDEMDDIQNLCYVRNPKKISEYWVHYRNDGNKYFETIDDVSFRERTGDGWRKYSYVDNILKYENRYKWDKKLDLYILVPEAINILQGALAEQKVADIIYDYTGGTVLLGSLKLEDTEMLGDFVIDGYPDTFVDVKGFIDHGERDISDYANEKLRKIQSKYRHGRLAIINCYTENNYTNRIYDDGNIIVVDGVHDGHQYKPDRINHLLQWIRSKKEL